MRSGGRFSLTLVRGSVLSCMLVAALAGCGEEGGAAAGAGEEQGATLTVFAASSLTDAFGELAKTFEEQNPGTEVKPLW